MIKVAALFLLLLLALPAIGPISDASGQGGQGGSPIVFCDGSALPAVATVDSNPETWWDTFARWLFNDDEGIPAISNGRVPSDFYSTAQIDPGACTAVIVGPRTILTAAHCFDLWGGPGIIQTEFEVTGALTSVRPEANETRYWVYRVVMTSERYAGTASGTDFALMYLLPSGPALPGPYVSTVYDFATDHTTCTRVLAQGYDGGGAVLHECDYYVGAQQGVADGYLFFGECYEPVTSQPVGGDSGGPLYTFSGGGGGGGAEQVQLAGIQSGGTQPNNRYSNLFVNEAWFQANLAAPAVPILTMEHGIQLDDFYLDVDLDTPQDLGTADVSIPCEIFATATANPIAHMGCTLQQLDTNITRSCFATSDVAGQWSCSVVLPRRSGSSSESGGWQLMKVFGQDTAGNRTERTMRELGRAGVTSVLTIGLAAANADGSPPTMNSYTVTQNPAPGGELMCVVKLQDQGVATSGAANAGCVFDSVSYGSSLTCAGSDLSKTAGTVGDTTAKWMYCSQPIPADVPTGSVWTLTKVFGQDKIGFSSSTNTPAGPAGFTTISCAAITPDLTANNGWGTTQAEALTYGSAHFEFYARPAVANQNAIVGISDATPIDGDTDLKMGIRFNASGNIDVRDGAAWTADSTIPYSANTWYHFRVLADKLTYVTGSPSGTYSVEVSACGSTMQTIMADADVQTPRIYDGVTYWNAWSSQTENVDVYGMDWTQQFCQVTFCAAEPTWGCSGTPNGCGGTINCGPCVGTCEADWTCTP